MPVLHGSCLCGGVKYEVAGPLFRPLNLLLLDVP